MPRPRAPSTNAPKPSFPIPAPLNIATSEYYRISTLDVHDADVDFPDSKTPSPQNARQQNPRPGEVVESQDMYDFVEVRRARVEPHSPTPSEIVLSGDLRDVVELSALNQGMRERGAPRGARKKDLLELQSRSVGERERERVAKEAGRVKLEDLEREYEETQRRGREKV